MKRTSSVSSTSWSSSGCRPDRPPGRPRPAPGRSGASTAPSRRAAAGASPRPTSRAAPPSRCTAAWRSPSSRQVGDQPPQDRRLKQGERPVQGQAHPHQRHQHGQLGDVLDRGPVGLRVQRQPVGQRGQADQHADPDQHHRAPRSPSGAAAGAAPRRGGDSRRQEVRQVGSHTPPYPPLPPRLPCPIPHPPSRRRCTPHDPESAQIASRPSRRRCRRPDPESAQMCVVRRPARCPRCGRHPGSGSPVTGPAPRRPSRWRRCSRARESPGCSAAAPAAPGPAR